MAEPYKGSQKTKSRTTIGSSHSFPGHTTKKKKKKTLIQKGTCTPMFIEVLFTVAKVWKHLECPVTDEQIRSACVRVCVCVSHYI